jgi:hypothetical protein
MTFDVMTSYLFHSILPIKNILYDFNHDGLQHES